MNTVRFSVGLLSLLLAAGCRSSSAPVDRPQATERPEIDVAPIELPANADKGRRKPTAPSQTVRISNPPKVEVIPLTKAGGQDVPAKYEPAAPASFNDVIEAQKALVAGNPSSVRELRRLFMLYIMAERFLEADELLSQVKEADRDDLTTLAAAHLANMLGEHTEAEERLQRMLERWKSINGIAIERCILCDEVRGYRLYTPYRGTNVKPGGYILIYIEPTGFDLRTAGGVSSLNLQYGWELLDDRDQLIRVETWERAKQSDREDRKEFTGEVREFHQKFLLPVPKNLAAGKYTVRVTVKDLNGGKTSTAKVSFTVAAL